MSSPRPSLDGVPDSDGNILAYVAPQSYFTERHGPRMVGRIMAVLFYGVSFSVCAHYFMSPDFQADSVASRCYTILLSVMNTAAAVTITIALISQSFAQERTIAFLDTSDFVESLWSLFFAITIILAQLSLARRAFLFVVYARTPSQPNNMNAWMAPRPILVFALLLVTTVISIVGYMINVSATFKLYAGSDRLSDLEIYALSAALLASAATDVVVTTILGWHWVRFLRCNQGFNKRTDSLLRKLIAFTLSTASFTTIPAVIGAVYKVSALDKSGRSANVIALPQLHAIAVFLALDVRRSLRQDRFLQPGAPTLPTVQAAKTTPRPAAMLAVTRESGSENIHGTNARDASLKSGESCRYVLGTESQLQCIEPSEADKLHQAEGSTNM